MKVEKLLDLSFKDYVNLDAINCSSMRCFEIDGPETYYRRYIMRTETGPIEKDLRVGRILHTRMEHPEDWQDRVAEFPQEIEGIKFTRHRKAHKAYEKEFLFELAITDKEIIFYDEIVMIEEWANSIDECLKECGYDQFEYESEVVFLATLHDGTKLKCLVDRYYFDHPLGKTDMDFKTTRMNHPITFCRDGRKLGYLHQAAWYLRITGAKRYAVVPVTKTNPPHSFVKIVQRDTLKEYEENNQATLEKIQQCKDWEDKTGGGINNWQPLWTNMETFWSTDDRYGG